MSEHIQKPRKVIVGAEIPVFDGPAEERVAAIDAAIAETEANLASVQERRTSAQERLSALNGEYAAARAERGQALAAGEDASAITKRLKKLAEEKEAVEDEISALSPIAPDLAEKRKALRAARTTAALEVARVALRAAARRYNEKAAELVPILQELWDARVLANESGAGRVARSPAGWIDGLISLPRLSIDEDGPLPAMKPSDHYFANERIWVAETSRRRLAAIEARRSEG